MCLTVHNLRIDMEFTSKAACFNLMDSRLKSRISKGFGKILSTCKLSCCLQHFPSVKMRNNAAVPCDSTKMSLKAYKDEFIKHLNIIAIRVQKNPKTLLLLSERDLDVIQ